MSDTQAPPAKGNIAPPSQLPSLFTDQKRSAGFAPPVPPQMHPFQTSGSQTAPPSIPPQTYSAAPPSVPPQAYSAAPPSVPPQVYSATPPSAPPQVSQTAPPSAPSEVPQTAPSSVKPEVSQVPLPSAPFQVYSAAPPSIPPQVYSAAPPSIPPQVYSEAPPSASPRPPPLPSHSLTEMPSTKTSKDKSNVRASPQPQPIAKGMNEVATALDKLEEQESSMLDWLQKTVTQSAFLSKVADKAKTGMDSVLTTLDPGMRDFLTTDGSVDMCIASDDERLITAVADGFRRLFTSVAIRGMGTPGASKLLSQIIGHSMAFKYANERISLLRGSGLTGNTSTLVAIQPFLHAIDDCWYESAVLVLQSGDVHVHAFTQPVQVDSAVISKLKEQTPRGYAANAFAKSVGDAYSEVFGIESEDWQQQTLQYSSSEIYRLAATSLAALFKRAMTIRTES